MKFLINIFDNFYYNENDKTILRKRKRERTFRGEEYILYCSLDCLLFSKGNGFKYSSSVDELEKKIFKAILEKHPEFLIWIDLN